MSNIAIKWSNRGFYKLRSEPGVIKELERRGQKIADAANRTLSENSVGNRIRERRRSRVGYRMSSFQGARKPQGRWFVQVYTSSNHAKRSDAMHNTLVRVLNETQRPTPPAVDPRQ